MNPTNPEILSTNEEVSNKVREIYGVNEEFSPEYFEAYYPERNLPEGAMVTRIGPSPTGEMHLGSIYMALACERLARESNGVFFVRIEDTDQKREVEGATDGISSALKDFGIYPDEGPEAGGEYGPYVQSDRGVIYRSVALSLLEQDKAYICFATGEETAEIAAKQEAEGRPIGYYGKDSLWRNRDADEVLAELEKGTPFVIRYKNSADPKDRVVVSDMVSGETETNDNYNDSVLIKADGLPTYHLAHVVDDHYMRTTHVIRGTEWFSSLPLHMQLFRELGWEAPIYAHVATIDKEDNGKQRKLSKRKDPEARAASYVEAGYLPQTIQAYLLNLLDSGFGEWRLANPTADIREYRLLDSVKALKKVSGSLFDAEKLKSIGRDEVAKLTAEEVLEQVTTWAQRHEYTEFETVVNDREYALKVFGLERGGEKPRKDIACWEDIRTELGFFFEELFVGYDQSVLAEDLKGLDLETISTVVSEVSAKYNSEMTLEDWQNLMKDIATENGFTTDRKAYKANPDSFKGFWGDVPKIIRLMIAGKNKSPDLYSVMKIMGEERLKARFEKGLQAAQAII